MKKNLTLSLITITFLVGCAGTRLTTNPNISYLYWILSIRQQLPEVETEIREGIQQTTAIEKEAVSLFEDLYKRNPKLAIELGKIPEFQDDISVAELEALRNILELYDIGPVTFDKAFNKMYEEGKPDVRKFCTPLQGLFWLAEQNNLPKGNSPLDNYRLENIIKKAWNGYPDYVFSREEINEILEDIKDPEMGIRIRRLYKSEIELSGFLSGLMNDPNFLHIYFKSGRKIFKGKGSSRWKHFIEVTDRLNSPSLVWFYMTHKISYSRGHHQILTPRLLFKYKEGHCHDQSLFAAYCLEKAGYNVLLVRAWSPGWIGHTVVAYDDNAQLYKFDNTRTRAIYGPYKSHREIAYSMGGGGGLLITILPWRMYQSRPLNR